MYHESGNRTKEEETGMDAALLEKLSVITDEEKAYLAGNSSIDRTLYYSAEKGSSSEVDSARVLGRGKLIDIRPNTRFVHFPRHTHNYVEFIYMCKGHTRHIIDGKEIILQEGDLLFLNQHAVQEVMPAGREDIAVNFMILPEFFDTVVRMLDSQEGMPRSSALRQFIISCLTGRAGESNYLYFHAAGILPVQNLMENLIWIMMNDVPGSRNISQITMGLLFMHLTGTSGIQVSSGSYEQNLVLSALSYIESGYRNAALADFAAGSGIDVYTASRMIRRGTGKTFKELLQERRLNLACYLLESTGLSVDEISSAIGYDNTSFFHRLFRKNFGCTPKEWRKSHPGA